jgi:nicotinate-nucleotide adenylyltransferase
VFGGTFDPPHLGHLVIAEEARVALGLDRVLLMPAASPPHKRVRLITPAAARVAMTRVAVRGNPAFEVSTIEARRRGPSYTVDTLRELKRLNPRTALTLILGEDSLRELGTWREPEQIAALARIAVARRIDAARSRRNGRAPAAAAFDRSALPSCALARHAADGDLVNRPARARPPRACAHVSRARGRRALRPAPRPLPAARVTYRPKEFWEQRLGEHFDLRGTGETGLPLAYNQACYALRRHELERALRDAGVTLAGKRVLDVGSGTGFFVAFYLERGADVTGLDLAEVSVERLRGRFPNAQFLRADVSDQVPGGTFDVVNAFDVLYHITDHAKWSAAIRHLAGAVAPGGVFVLTDLFGEGGHEAEHNVIRPLAQYRDALGAAGLTLGRMYPTHVLLNRALGPWRFLNRLPWLLYGVDRTLLSMGVAIRDDTNRILVAHRPAATTRA